MRSVPSLQSICYHIYSQESRKDQQEKSTDKVDKRQRNRIVNNNIVADMQVNYEQSFH